VKNILRITFLLQIFLSTNQAQWKFIEFPTNSLGDMECLNNLLFAISSIGYQQNVLLRSSDNGETWYTYDNTQPPYMVGKLFVYKNIIFAKGTNSLYRSLDYGINWAEADSGINDSNIYDICTFNDSLYVKTDTKIFLSTDNGTSWKSIAENIDGQKILVTKEIIYIGSYNLRWSSDNCRTWHQENFGVDHLNYIYSIFNTGDGILVGCDNGYSATGEMKYLSFKMYENSTYVKVLDDEARAFVSNGEFIIMVCLNHIYCSKDKGQSWKLFDQGISDSLGLSYNFFDASSNRESLFVSCYYYPTTSGIYTRLISDLTSIYNDQNKNTIINYSLSQNYPNPFNPTTTIEYEIPKRTNVKIEVFDLLGKNIETLLSKEQSAGNYKLNYDASKLSSGIYFYKITAGGFVQTKKMILIK
jgi:hypothetical protein